MIREVHVYGKVAAIDEKSDSVQRKQNKLNKVHCEQSEKDKSMLLSTSGVMQGTRQSRVQHLGLGRQLIDRACEIAADAGFARLNVISSVGTRQYYRKLGFEDNYLYQAKELKD
jgi:histone acetyltransferase (RNA polymerase elongator complex component)